MKFTNKKNEQTTIICVWWRVNAVGYRTEHAFANRQPIYKQDTVDLHFAKPLSTDGINNNNKLSSNFVSSIIRIRIRNVEKCEIQKRCELNDKKNGQKKQQRQKCVNVKIKFQRVLWSQRLHANFRRNATHLLINAGQRIHRTSTSVDFTLSLSRRVGVRDVHIKSWRTLELWEIMHILPAISYHFKSTYCVCARQREREMEYTICLYCERNSEPGIVELHAMVMILQLANREWVALHLAP